MPSSPRLFTATVVRSTRISPSFVRVTIAGEQLDEFDWVGHDHWFRLFLPPRPDVALQLPEVSGRGWYKPYLAIPEAVRPHCSNYTVADLRQSAQGVEMDIDVVLHWDAAGAIAGAVAIWANSAAPGSPVALLDQGRLFDLPDDAREVHLVADETGLPAVRGILRDLDPTLEGSAIVEVPDPGDIEELAGPPGVEVTFVSRSGAAPGAAALAELRQRAAPAADAYAFVVGESTLATEGRRALHRAGLPKSRITFSGFWKHTPHRAHTR